MITNIDERQGNADSPGMAVVAAAQPWLFDVPATEPKRVKTKWEELAEMAEKSAEVGGLIQPSLAAKLLDFSRQRAYEMIETGRLQSWEFFGHRYVSAREVHAYMESDRKPGRPWDRPLNAKGAKK